MFTVSVRDGQSIEEVNDNDGGIQPEEVNQRPAVSAGVQNLVTVPLR